MTSIVWFRNDLRVTDHPALARAVEAGGTVLPVFILNKNLLGGKHASSNRNRFLIECLEDLKAHLQALGADLIIRSGEPSKVLCQLAGVVQADTVYFTEDYTPYAVARDKQVSKVLQAQHIETVGCAGRLAIDDIDSIKTKSDTYHKVFTPFWRVWMTAKRREVIAVPHSIPFPKGVDAGSIPEVTSLTRVEDLSPEVVHGGETEGRKILHSWLDMGIDNYDKIHNDLAADATSHLSPYLHFGCLSVREIETMLPSGEGARAWHRQLAWREFYNYTLFHNPTNATQEFQERYRQLKWSQNRADLTRWQNGQTGYPIVDAAMRQLNQTGWMHNRARLIVGSFLTKDLWLDWRLGEQYFMRMLLDGDEANNNGNWQWIASVGVDPAPVFRRLYNPASQAKNYDPSGAYIRRYVPELAKVPDQYLAEPHLMPAELQTKIGCIIGTDYPAPMVDHKAARLYALEQYRSV